MTKKLAKILVGISGGSHKVLARATELAERTGAEIELFTVVRPVLPVIATAYDAPAATDYLVKAARAELDKLAAKVRRQGCRVGIRVAVDEHVAQGLLRRVESYQPDLVAIEAHKHSVFARLLLTQTDFELVRRCPVPLLIVKNTTTKAKGVLAAVDPEHAHSKPRALDQQILSYARSMADTLGGTLHSAYAYLPIMSFVEGPFAPIAYPISSAEEKKYRSKMKALFLRMSRSRGITKRNAHSVVGDPVFMLPRLAKTARARLVVMGAVSRRYLKRLLIGSIAERVLDMMPCDLLIVKPPGIRSVV